MKLDTPCMSGAIKNFKRLIKYSKDEKNVRFEEMLPLALKNNVSGKGGDAKKSGCIQEMAQVFSCLKTNEFDQTSCAQEIKSFLACADQRRSDKYIRKKEFHNKIMSTGTKDLKAWEINALLKKYPNLKD